MIDSNLMNEIREAADNGKTSLHEGEVCPSCGGKGSNPCRGLCCMIECFKCNGTGKAVK